MRRRGGVWALFDGFDTLVSLPLLVLLALVLSIPGSCFLLLVLVRGAVREHDEAVLAALGVLALLALLTVWWAPLWVYLAVKARARAEAEARAFEARMLAARPPAPTNMVVVGGEPRAKGPDVITPEAPVRLPGHQVRFVDFRTLPEADGMKFRFEEREYRS